MSSYFPASCSSGAPSGDGEEASNPCDNDLACDGGFAGICPEGYFCALPGATYLPDDGAEKAVKDAENEEACITGQCVQFDTGDLLEGGQRCNRCEAGWAIPEWDIKYWTEKGDSDCEFTEETCPGFCTTPGGDAEGTECAGKDDPGECPSCEDQTITCTFPDSSPYEKTCPGDSLKFCDNRLYTPGDDPTAALSVAGKYKGFVANQPLLYCCGGCEFCNCTKCPGLPACTSDADCDAGEICGRDDIGCADCRPPNNPD